MNLEELGAAPVPEQEWARTRLRGVRVALVPVLLLFHAACFGDRDRPGGVTDPDGVPALTARILAPRDGAVILADSTIPVVIAARDLRTLYLEGVGFVARRMTFGGGTVDSVAVRFAMRSDSTHEFSLVVPDVPTNTQIDIYGIAYGTGGVVQLSEPVHLTVARISGGAGTAMAWRLH